MECFHSRGQHICKFIGTKESVYIRKEFNSHRTGSGHQHGRRDVMWKHSIKTFAADTKIYREINNAEDTSALQSDLDCLENWTS